MTNTELQTMLVHDTIINQMAEELLNAYRKSLANNKVNASGALSDTADWITKMDGTHLQIWFDLKDYWYYVEHGRKPGKRPPISAIEKWISNKKIVPSANANGRIPTTKQLAFAISKTIGEKGTQYFQMGGSTLLQDAINDNRQLVDKIIDRISELVQNDLSHDIASLFSK